MSLSQHDQLRLQQVVGQMADGTIDDEQAAELTTFLTTSSDARDYYLMYMSIHSGLLWKHQTPQPELLEATHEAMAMPAKSQAAKAVSAAKPFWHPMTLVLALGLLSVGILIYKFSTQPAELPVVTGPSTLAAPAVVAKVVGATDVQWRGPFSPDGKLLKAGQRLILQRGSVEIVLNKQARVIFEAPADFVIDDAATCRLVGGKLTAHVPEPARGFKVHTPDGTVTDLGTEFGVYVKSEVKSEKSEVEEQKEGGQPQEAVKLSPITEVHVFQGQVEVSTSEVGGRKSDVISQNPTSDLRLPTLVAAGHAVTISENKVQPLHAADPFKFALDKLQGKPRTVLLSDDFETYELGNQVQAIGTWIVQSGTRKGQGVNVENPAEMITAANATVDPSVRLPAPPTLVGSRVTNFGTSPQNSTDTYPVLGREIDGKLLAKNCQVLVEFDFFPRSDEPQLSLALATQLGHTAGIELWRSIDAAKQSVDAAKQGVDAANKVDFVSYRWYRVRVLLSVADGVVSEVRVDRSQWRGSEGWVRDLSYQPPTPKLDWSTPPRYAIFGFPVVSPATVGGVFWLDNVRIEVIAEK